MDYHQWVLIEAYARCSRLQATGLELLLLSSDEIEYLSAYPGPQVWEWQPATTSGSTAESFVQTVRWTVASVFLASWRRVAPLAGPE